MNTHIQFTAEIEENNSLPFLDILLLRQEDGSIKTSVFRKPTHTDKYLDFNSHHPLSHKSSVVRTLYHRSHTLASTTALQSKEDKHIHNALKGKMDIQDALFIGLLIKFKANYLILQQSSLTQIQFKRLNQLLL